MNTPKTEFDFTTKLCLTQHDVVPAVELLNTKNIVLIYSKNEIKLGGVTENDIADIIFFGPGTYSFLDKHAGLIQIENGKIKSIEKAHGIHPENTMFKIYTDKHKMKKLGY